MTVGERIKEARLKAGLSADELAEKIGKDRSTIYRYESKEIEKLPTTVLEPLCKALHTTPAYLMGWEDNDTPIKSNIAESPYILINTPIYEFVSAGNGTLADSNIVGYEPLPYKNEREASEYFGIWVKGDSMSPKIEDGDLVQVHRQESVENGDIGVALIGDEGLVKKIVFTDDYLSLVSLNPDYAPKMYIGEDMNNVKIQGKVVRVVKTL